MKKAISILFFILLVNISFAQLKGWNNVLPLTQSLLEQPLKAKALAEKLKTLDVNDKVLRFPAGTGGKDYVFDYDLTIKFAQFCHLAEVEKLTLVVNQNDISGFLQTYKILSQDFDIELIEFDNENYLWSHMKKSIKGSEIWTFIFNKNKFIELKAKQYVEQFKEFKSILEDANIDIPLGAAIPIPFGYRDRIWTDIVKKETDNLIVHVYGKPDEKNYFKNLGNALNSLKEYSLYLTEVSPIHFGDNINASQNEQYYLSDKFFEMKKDLEDELSKHSNIKMILSHCLFGWENYPNHYKQFEITEDNQVKDLYEN